MTTELVELADRLEQCVSDWSYDMKDAAFAQLNQFPDELRALASRAGGWLPIESAPMGIDPHTKCGEVIMLGGPGWSSQGFYHDGSHCYGHRGEAGFFDSEDWGEDRLLIASNVHPTHWQPLPEPPAAPEPVATKEPK